MSEETMDQGARGPFAPMLLLALALLVLIGFQSMQLFSERGNLRQAKANQDQPMQESQTLRAQLDGIAGDTARLAEQGNANAQRVIDELRRRGITVNPNGEAQRGD